MCVAEEREKEGERGREGEREMIPISASTIT
jgi:hypothetical protein